MDTATKTKAWSVLVIDDHELLSSAIQIAFAADGRAEVVATATSLAAGRDAAALHRPDVVLTDRRLPDGDADQQMGALLAASPGSRVLMMTGWPTERSSLAALEAGANGIVAKTEPIERILDAVERVATGDLVLPTDLRDRVLGRRQPGRAELSPRELDVLEALASGESSEDAADRLCMSHNTLRNHLSRAMLKLDVHDRLSAVTESMRLGLVSPRIPHQSAAGGASP